MGNQAGIIIRNVKNELFHSAKRLILNEVKGIECLLPIEIYSSLPQDVELFNGLDFTAILTIEDWINQEVYREMATYSPLRSIFK